jgi:TPR repeat protein
LRLAALSDAAPDPAGLAQALQAYQQAADQGDPLAIYMLARARWCAEGCAHDAEQALRDYTRAADLGDAGAQFCLGYMYANGQGVAQDYALAARWYLAAAGAPPDPVATAAAPPLATPQTQEVGLAADVQG